MPVRRAVEYIRENRDDGISVQRHADRLAAFGFIGMNPCRATREQDNRHLLAGERPIECAVTVTESTSAGSTRSSVMYCGIPPARASLPSRSVHPRRQRLG